MEVELMPYILHDTQGTTEFLELKNKKVSHPGNPQFQASKIQKEPTSSNKLTDVDSCVSLQAFDLEVAPLCSLETTWLDRVCFSQQRRWLDLWIRWRCFEAPGPKVFPPFSGMRWLVEMLMHLAGLDYEDAWEGTCHCRGGQAPEHELPGDHV